MTGQNVLLQNVNRFTVRNPWTATGDYTAASSVCILFAVYSRFLPPMLSLWPFRRITPLTTILVVLVSVCIKGHFHSSE